MMEHSERSPKYRTIKRLRIGAVEALIGITRIAAAVIQRMRALFAEFCPSASGQLSKPIKTSKAASLWNIPSKDQTSEPKPNTHGGQKSIYPNDQSHRSQRNLRNQGRKRVSHDPGTFVCCMLYVHIRHFICSIITL